MQMEHTTISLTLCGYLLKWQTLENKEYFEWSLVLLPNKMIFAKRAESGSQMFKPQVMESVMEFGSATIDSHWAQEPHKDFLKRNVTWVKYLFNMLLNKR